MAISPKLTRSPRGSAKSSRKFRKVVKECGGEGGKPGPCAEHHGDETHHGVGGKPHPEDVAAANKRIGNRKRHMTPHQEQVHADIMKLAGGEKATVTLSPNTNSLDHGNSGQLNAEVYFRKDADNLKAKLGKLRKYADQNGLYMRQETLGGGGTNVSLDAPRVPPNDRQKEVAQLYNAAMMDAGKGGDDSAMHGLADKLEEMGAPIAAELSKLVNDGEYRRARNLLMDHRWKNGSILAKGGKGNRVTESVNMRRTARTWHVAESCDSSKVRVDRKKGVIYDVLVLGRKARNGRRYTDEAMEEALKRKLYDSLQVYIGPHKRKKYDKRSPNDHAGELRELYKAPDGIRAREFHVNRVSRGGRLAMEVAERFPNSFGLSHHADVAGYEDENGEKIVTRILEVAVADIVKDAATTDGVFEETDMAEEQVETVVEEGEVEVETPAMETDTGGGWKDAMKELIAAIHADDDIDDDVKVKATKKAMDLKKLLSGDEGVDEEEAETESPEGEEEVDVAALMKRIAALESAQKRRPSKPKSTARSEVVEEATPPKRKADVKPVYPKKREDILAAYDEG